MLLVTLYGTTAHASSHIEHVADGHGGYVDIDYSTLREAFSYDATGRLLPPSPAERVEAAAEETLWKRMPWYEKLGWGGYAVGSAADIASTSLCIARRGGQEGNPIVRAVLGKQPGVGPMIAYSVALGYGISWWEHKHHRNARAVAGLVGTGRLLVAGANIVNCRL